MGMSGSAFAESVHGEARLLSVCAAGGGGARVRSMQSSAASCGWRSMSWSGRLRRGLQEGHMPMPTLKYRRGRGPYSESTTSLSPTGTLGVGVAVWGKVAEGIGPDIGVTVFHGVGVEGFVVSGIGGFVDGGGVA